ncbi:MAG: GNAT family N-acetyltransferase [Clostridiales bacterium]|nr:GNAT family N-acetyltransferase [Clostridiales bacterium]
MKYKTERLIIREIKEGDVSHLIEMDNNPNVMKYITTSGFNPTSAEIELTSIHNQKKYYKKFQGFGLWMIQTTADTIGWISLKYNSDLESYELGYRLKESEWNKGYATEACKGLLEYIRKLDISQIQAVAVPANRGSIAVMKKIGMIYTKNSNIYNEDVVVYRYVV